MGDTLEKNGIRDVKDMLLRVPGISYGGVDRGLSNYNIRGIGTTANSPTVGIYLDDIALNTIATGFTGAFDPVFFDMERLEVLKGPQGTLYGGSAMGGAIKYVSRRPVLDRVSVDAAAGVGSTDGGSGSYNAEAVLNLPVSATVAVRGGFYYRHNGGFIDNVAGGATGGALVNRRFSTVNPPGYAPTTRDTLSTHDDENYNSDRTVAGRLSLLFQPDPSWTILASAFYQDYRQANPSIYFPNLSGLTSSYRLAGQTSDKDGVYSLSIEKDLGGVKLTSLSAYFSREIAFDRDYSFFIGSLVRPLYPLNSFNQSTSSTDTYSQEVRLASDNGSDARFNWIVGGFVSRQNDRLIQIVTTPGGEASLGGTATGYFGNIHTVTKQYSAFGEVTYSPFDRFKITLGGRYFDIGIDVDSVGSGLLNGGNTSVVSTSKERGFNPKALLSYQAARDNLLYASAAKGFRPGGPNRNNISATVCGADLARLGLTTAPSGFGSDNLWTYEVGTKNQFVDRKITVNASAYYTDWKDIQQTVLLPGCGFSFTGNIGKARVKGGEIELSATPFAGFTIGGNASYTDSQIQETAVGVSAQAGDGILGVPKWTASAFGSATFPMGDIWQGIFLVNYQYQGGARRQFERTQLTIYPNAARGQIPNLAEFREAYDVVNAQLSFQRDDLTIRAYMNNMFNVHPAYDVRVDLGAVTYGTIRPRTVGLETRVRF